jgi:protein ImuA
LAALLNLKSLMTAEKANIIQRLQREILPLQGFRPKLVSADLDVGLGQIKNAFPGASFPLGAVHEFIYTGEENAAATGGFVAGILGSLMKNNGVAIWISAAAKIFPPALRSFGISPDKIVFINIKKEKEIQWAIEEALKCDGLNAVVGELPELNFKASRRLQLAVEQSKVTGFILRNDPRSINTTACISRWKISCLPSELHNGMPGVGFPRWNVELQKIRNGRPGNWQLEFSGGRFRHISKAAVITHQQQRKTG